METRWLKEALFAGMTANAFKLGTVLTLGWFWPRVVGCSVLYRGSSMEAIDFANILAVAEADASQVQPPSYVRHDSNSTYFYVVRRANNCGEQEHTLAAAVKVSIDTDGDIALPQPNSVFEATAKQMTGNRLELLWYYCPLDQKSAPVCFKIYCDSGTGQIDYENPIATISYVGRKFYSYRSDTLQAGRYLFAIRAEDASGVESSSLARLAAQITVNSLDAINILSAKAV